MVELRNVLWAPAALVLACTFSLAPSFGQPPPNTELRIVVVEGDDAINNIAAGTARAPVVRVEDSEGKPVPGATVAFTLPSMGPGGAFANGQRQLIVQTDTTGQAAGQGLKPNQAPGQFEIRVMVSYQGRSISVTFRQTNVLPAEPAPAAAKKIGGSGKLIAILAAVAGGGAAAAVAVMGGGNKGGGTTPTPPTTPTTTVIVVGGSGIGPQ